MFSKLMPKEVKFFDLFNAHADLISKGGRELVLLVADLPKGQEVLQGHWKNIDEMEQRADKYNHDTVALLHTSFNTPLDQGEMYKLISNMDDVLDTIQDFAETMYLYDVRKLTHEAVQLADICSYCCERVKDAVGLISNMDNAQSILKTCAEIDRLESDADRVMRTGMAKLFREEADTR